MKQAHSVSPGISFIDLDAALSGYKRFFCTYLLRGEKTALIETGPRACAPEFMEAVDGSVGRKNVDYIILTHIHLDHAGGIGTVHREMPHARVIAHPRARAHLAEPSRLWAASRATLGELALKWGEIEPVPEESIIEAHEGMRLDLGAGLAVEFYHTPGHAPHHLSIFEPVSRTFFSGEAAGVWIDSTHRPTCGPPFRLDVTLSSMDRLAALEPLKICYAHFGCYEDAPAKIRTVREQMLRWYDFVRAHAANGSTPGEILERLRRHDSSLHYLEGLDTATFDREYSLLSNSVRGLCQAAAEGQ